MESLINRFQCFRCIIETLASDESLVLAHFRRKFETADIEELIQHIQPILAL